MNKRQIYPNQNNDDDTSPKGIIGSAPHVNKDERVISIVAFIIFALVSYLLVTDESAFSKACGYTGISLTFLSIIPTIIRKMRSAISTLIELVSR
jgi:hypothetical protein